jgi:hypothetical protein
MEFQEIQEDSVPKQEGRFLSQRYLDFSITMEGGNGIFQEEA